MSHGTSTPGPWKWWTSNSWRRLKRDDPRETISVIEPYVCRDGHPDCMISAEDMALIAAAPDMLTALKAVNKLVSEAAMTGFNCLEGDWAERLFQSQQATHAAIRKAEGR